MEITNHSILVAFCSSFHLATDDFNSSQPSTIHHLLFATTNTSGVCVEQRQQQQRPQRMHLLLLYWLRLTSNMASHPFFLNFLSFLHFYFLTLTLTLSLPLLSLFSTSHSLYITHTLFSLTFSKPLVSIL